MFFYKRSVFFPNYLFYNDGSIFSLFKRKFIHKNILENGYCLYHLTDYQNKRISIYAHRLIYFVFNYNISFNIINNSPDTLKIINSFISKNYVIDHKNEIRSDNSIENLQLLSVRDNIIKSKQNNNPIYKQLDKKHYNKFKKTKKIE